jgi:hypothetical protein
MLGYVSCYPATEIVNIAPAFTGPTKMYSLGPTQCAAASLTATVLNSVTIPGLIQYGTADEVVGYSGVTTVGAGFSTTAAASVTSLPLTSGTGFVQGALVTVTTTTGYAVYSYTGGTSTLTGMVLLYGSGNVVAGAAVVQSLTLSIINNQQAAQPSNQVTVNVTGNTHEFTNQDAGASTYPVVSGSQSLTSLSGGNLTIQTTAGNLGGNPLVSGACAIWGSDNVWHTLNFTSQPSNTQLNGVTFGGSGSATVTSTSPICQTNYATGAAIPYWINQTLSPLAVRAF